MNIAFILPSLKATAPGFVIKDIIKGLLEIDSNLSIVVFYLKESESPINFPVKTKKISFFKPIDFNDFDIIHSNLFKPDLYVFLHTIFNKKVKKISTLHSIFLDDLLDTFGFLKSRIYGFFWSLSWASFDKLIVLSSTSKKSYNKILPFYNNKFEIINNGRDIDFNIVNSSMNNSIYESIMMVKNDNNILIGTCCVVRELKGLDQVIYALTLDERLNFMLIGDGPDLLRLKELAISLNVNDRFYTLGRHEDAYKYMSLFDVYIMPSISEGFGLALLEAAAQKCSVVASNIDIFKEIFPNEVIFFDVNNINSLVKAILESYSSDMGNDIYNKYCNNYTVEIMSKNYYKLYNDLLGDFRVVK
ncbi:glycosyltransferase family 4 protein [Photobacterium piscicola]|uniref:glycosyltransferase family 4 protein n=1 Tax=Photobacterium piscicola TaxID=1378299 RepID=UPI0038CF845D